MKERETLVLWLINPTVVIKKIFDAIKTKGLNLKNYILQNNVDVQCLDMKI